MRRELPLQQLPARKHSHVHFQYPSTLQRIQHVYKAPCIYSININAVSSIMCWGFKLTRTTSSNCNLSCAGVSNSQELSGAVCVQLSAHIRIHVLHCPAQAIHVGPSSAPPRPLFLPDCQQNTYVRIIFIEAVQLLGSTLGGERRQIHGLRDEHW